MPSPFAKTLVLLLTLLVSAWSVPAKLWPKGHAFAAVVNTLALSQTWNMFAPEVVDGRIFAPDLLARVRLRDGRETDVRFTSDSGVGDLRRTSFLATMLGAGDPKLLRPTALHLARETPADASNPPTSVRLYLRGAWIRRDGSSVPALLPEPLVVTPVEAGNEP